MIMYNLVGTVVEESLPYCVYGLLSKSTQLKISNLSESYKKASKLFIA